jgi:membrane dipeptidase
MTADGISALLASAPVWDGHNDLAWELRQRVGGDLDAVDLTGSQRDFGLHTDIPRLRAGGVGAQYWSVYVPCGPTEPESVVAVLEQIDLVRRIVARYPDALALATSADEVERAWAGGRIASLLGAEGGHCIANSLGVLRALHGHGVRYLTLTHNRNTAWADSATDAPAAGGLTRFGREVVRECNRLGMIADLSHVAPSTMHAALDVSEAPAFFSHSNARALCDHPRNVPDDVLRRVRDSNGIVMITFVPSFLTEQVRLWMAELIKRRKLSDADIFPDQWAQLREGYAREHPVPGCSVSDVVAHVEHVADVAGVDHVGLGGDFDGTIGTPQGLDGVDGYPNLLAALAERGWSDADLARLASGNALRVLRDTEAVARVLQATRGPSMATIAELDPPAAAGHAPADLAPGG